MAVLIEPLRGLNHLAIGVDREPRLPLLDQAVALMCHLLIPGRRGLASDVHVGPYGLSQLDPKAIHRSDFLDARILAALVRLDGHDLCSYKVSHLLLYQDATDLVQAVRSFQIKGFAGQEEPGRRHLLRFSRQLAVVLVEVHGRKRSVATIGSCELAYWLSLIKHDDPECLIGEGRQSCV